MSLYFSSEERIDPKLTDPKKVKEAPECPLLKRIWELRSDFNKIGYPLKFKFRKETGLTLESGERLLPGRKSFANQTSVSTENGAESLIYCEREKRNAEGVLEYFPPKIYFTTEHYVDEKDWDRAVFLYLSKIENNDYPIIVLEDLNKENRERGEALKIQTKISNIIMNPNAYKLGKEKFEKLVESYGLPVTTDMVTNQLALLDELNERNEKDHETYTKFLENYNNEEKIGIRKNINIALEKAVIEYSEKEGKVWRYVASEGAAGDVILSCNNSATNKDELVSFFIKNPSMYEDLEKILKSKVEKVESE